MTRRETTTRQAAMTAAARAGKQHAEPPGPGWRTVMLRVAGAGLLIAAGAIHLALYLTSYRTIPVIGWLFLLQVIAAFAFGLAVLAAGGRPVLAGRLAAAGGAGFALAIPRRLPAVGLDRVVRVPRGPHHRRRGCRRDRGGCIRGPGHPRAGPCPGRRPGRRRGGDPAQIPHPDSPPRSPSDRPGGSNDRGGPGGGGAGSARSRGSRGQSAHARHHEHRHGPEDHGHRRDDGTGRRPGLHRLLVRPGHPDHVEMLRQLRRVLVTGTAPASPSLPGRIGTITRTGESRQLTYNGHR
jgi:hypothetical protein